MPWKEWLFVFCLIGPGQARALCRASYYPSVGKCEPCPDRCQSCESPVICTECRETFYGPKCNLTCPQCSGRCHQVYGHCTFGCLDGTYAPPINRTCTDCMPNCEVCSTASDCIRCSAGRYGPVCQRRCIDACVDDRCDVTTGTCSGCDEGDFRVGGICQRCADGCARCVGAGYCTKHENWHSDQRFEGLYCDSLCDNTRCQVDFYGPYNGTCIAICPTMNRRRKFWATSGDRCGTKKGDITHDTPASCENIPSGQSYTCSSAMYCMSFVECSDVRCTLGQGDADDNDGVHAASAAKDGACATVMSQKCNATCKAHSPVGSGSPVDEDVKHQCTEWCAVESPEDDDAFYSVCFHGNIPRSGNYSNHDADALFQTTVSCFTEGDTAKPFGLSYDLMTIILIGVAAFAAVSISVPLLVFCCRSRKSSRPVPDILQPEEQMSTGMVEGNPPPRNQPKIWSEGAGMKPLRNADTLHREDNAKMDASAGMTGQLGQPSEPSAEYMTLMDPEEDMYDSIESHASYVDCGTARHKSESDGNSRSATETDAASDYLTPVQTVHFHRNY